MSDYDRNVAARGFGAERAIAIDAGLRAYMIRVYNYMAAGVALTGVVAWLTFNAAVVTDAAGTITGLTPRSLTTNNCAAVAQLDRASAFEAEGHRFEPCRPRHLSPVLP